MTMNAQTKERDAVTDVAEAFTHEYPQIGWRAGVLYRDGREVLGTGAGVVVRFGDVVDWVPYEKRGRWGTEFADRLKAKGRFQPVIALDDGGTVLGQDVLWTTENRMCAWMERMADEAAEKEAENAG